MRSLGTLIKTVVGVTCVATTMLLAALMLKELASPAPLAIDFAKVPMRALFAGAILGVTLFIMDRRGG